MESPETPHLTAPRSDKGNSVAIICLTIICVLQLPVTILFMSVFVSLMMQNAMSLCMISETIGETLQNMGGFEAYND